MLPPFLVLTPFLLSEQFRPKTFFFFGSRRFKLFEAFFLRLSQLCRNQYFKFDKLVAAPVGIHIAHTFALDEQLVVRLRTGLDFNFDFLAVNSFKPKFAAHRRHRH